MIGRCRILGLLDFWVCFFVCGGGVSVGGLSIFGRLSSHVFWMICLFVAALAEILRIVHFARLLNKQIPVA